MKAALIASALAATASAHTIFQKLSVNGADQGALVGIRTPNTNTPIQDTSSANLACNTGFHSPVSSTIINVPAGAKVGSWWGHVIGGAQIANDPDNPIAKSHHGPIQAYLAKVDNAATTGTSGLKWFKVASDGLDSSGVWGVDRMVANGGWSYFTMPTCVASGNYLLRVELLALHSAYSQNGEQFYISCAQINIQNGGSLSPATVSLPGAYSPTDPGILLNIYNPTTNAPDNGGKPYTPPGPAVVTCPAGSTNPGTPTTLSTSAKPATSTTASAGGTAALYGQCGGQGWTGPTVCASGKCTANGAYYSQCLP